MKFIQIVFVIILSCLTAVATIYCFSAHRNGALALLPETKETAFDRITKTNTLRCGYAVDAPWTVVDPNTGKISGFNYDITNAIAGKIGLKVDWVEETGWGTAEQGLITGRYDMLCGNVCVDPRRARSATYSTPFVHIPHVAVVRIDDTRFDNASDPLKLINNKSIKAGVKNGHVFEFTANERFPQAEKVYANDISDDSEFFEMLKTHKIDVAFGDQSMVDLYNEKNPGGKVKSLPVPVRFCNGA
jgi:ABC-type amino acid transport substrate-binding protein